MQRRTCLLAWCLLAEVTQLNAFGGFDLSIYPITPESASTPASRNIDISEVAEKFLFQGEAALRQLKGFKSDKHLSHLYFPISDKDQIIDALGFSGKDTSGGWLTSFSTKVTIPRDGRFRFVGLGDSVLVVRANNQPALDARSEFYAPEKYRLEIDYLSDGAGIKNRSLRAGPWMSLRQGSTLALDILFGGDEPQGAFYLMLDEEGADYPRPTPQGGAYPLFAMGEVDPSSFSGGMVGAGRNPPIQDAVVFPLLTVPTGSTSVQPLPPTTQVPADLPSQPAVEDRASENLNRWEGDFHLKRTLLGKAKGKMTLWFRGLGSGTRWVFEVASVPETNTQLNATNHFICQGEKISAKTLSKRGLNTAKQSFLESQHREERGEQEKGICTSVAYEFDVYSSELAQGKSDEPPETLDEAERRENLNTSYPFNIDGKEVKKWITEHELIRREGERDLAFGNRVQVFMTKYFTYNADRGMSFEEALRYRGIACGGAALLFASIMRNNDIPARIRGGRWLQTQSKGPDGGQNLQVHVKVDCYAEGIGWVCVEFPYGEKDPQKITEIFGRDGHFLTMQINPFVTRKDHFILDQGFRAYTSSQGQPYTSEWWEAEIVR
jgi:hypothetical protein